MAQRPDNRLFRSLSAAKFRRGVSRQSTPHMIIEELSDNTTMTTDTASPDSDAVFDPTVYERDQTFPVLRADFVAATRQEALEALGIAQDSASREQAEAILESLPSADIPATGISSLIESTQARLSRLTDGMYITEKVTTRSPETLSKLISTDSVNSDRLLNELKASFSDEETFKENEEMAKDAIVGSAMESMADDACQVNEKTKRIVRVTSTDPDLAQFLQNFLEYNVNIEERIWEWTYEVIKHGDFKLRRRVFETGYGANKANEAYYENVSEPYKISRIEYMGKVICYLDSEEVDADAQNSRSGVRMADPDDFVHFLNTKLPQRKKVTISYKNEQGTNESIVCHKVQGVSIMDNARYIFRIVNLLDNMLVLSRVARSTQYNIVKVEVGNATPAQTQAMLSDVRRTLEGVTRMKGGRGIKSDPSPIPVNSNVYIPTRDGKGDVTVESVNESVDVRSITDVDYFRNKEFATLHIPKSYLGFEEEMPGSMGNASLVKLDIRYARPVQKVQTIIRYGVENLCNNYLRFRGRPEDVGKFDIEMRTTMSAENAAKVEEFTANLDIFDRLATFMDTFSDSVDRNRLLLTVLNLIGISPDEVGTPQFLELANDIESGKYRYVKPPEEESTEGDDGSYEDY